MVNNYDNIIKDLLEGKLYYLYDKLPKNLTINKGEKKNKLKKVLITKSINKYIPQMYKWQENDDEANNSNYLRVSILEILK